jgi:chemotaxis protein MotB
MVWRKSHRREEPPEVRVLVRRPRGQGGHSGGTWKVAYGDFVTTLFALFIVLWASNQNPQVRQAISDYFRKPNAASQASGSARLLSAQLAAAESEGLDSTLEAVAKRLDALINADAEFKGLRDQIWIEVTPEGLRIHLMEKDDSLFFDIGSATLKPATRGLLGLIARVAGQLPNEVAIEGHTDSRPYQGGLRDYSNWELSADRANSARRAMEESGLRPRQATRVMGYADHRLLEPESPRDAKNRRVSIIIKRRTGKDGESEELRQLLAENQLSARPEKNPRR